MAYLILSDYYKQIKRDQLANIQAGEEDVLYKSELAAIEEARSHLVQKYDFNVEITDTLKWDIGVTYKAANRVYLDATAYSNTATYVVGNLALYNSDVYKCKTAINTGEAFNIAKWDLLGKQYTIFYASYPKPLFNLYGNYAIGDEVFYKDSTYRCKSATQYTSHAGKIQYENTAQIPNNNIFPDASNGGQQWTKITDYTIAAGTLPADTTKWTKGDNRGQQLLMYIIDIALYHLYSSISPQNVPELRESRYDNAIAWLKAAARGNVTAALPVIQPKQGRRIRAISSPKNDNRL